MISYERTLQALRGSDEPLTMAQWAKRSGKSVATISRAVRKMVANGDAIKVAPKGGERAERYRAYYSVPESLRAVEQDQPLTRLELLQLLVSWSKKPWEPKAFRSARTLPVGIAQLYGYAVEASYGAKVAQSDLDSVRNDMQEFLSDLQSLIKVVAGVLQTDEIWNDKKFVEFLLSDRDPAQVQEFVHRVRELN